MTDELLINIINFAKNHFLPTTDNHKLLKEYLNHYYYHNGAIEFNENYEKIISQQVINTQTNWHGNQISYTLTLNNTIHQKQEITITEKNITQRINNDKIIGEGTTTENNFTITLKEYYDKNNKTYYTGCEITINK